MSETAAFWRGSFGTEYIDRNRFDWTKRVPFWRRIIEKTRPASLMEVGCNIGSNLRAIRKADPSIDVYGLDINQTAIREASDAGLSVFEADALDVCNYGVFDMVASCGVLIHVAPDDLDEVMNSIIMASRKWVLAVEYADETEIALEYRGNTGKLWRRPFGELYANKGLKLVEEFDAPSEAFDRCRVWLMERA
jgi:spore coat polysaccharide biosynthesis protein SpsF